MRTGLMPSLAALCVATAAFGPTGQAQEPNPPRHKLLLENLADQVLAPGYRALGQACTRLGAAITAFRDQPSADTLSTARQAWLEAAREATRLHAWQSGPVVDLEYASTFYYWQIQPRRIEALVASAKPIDQSFLDEQGATVKGLYALEYLLFDDNSLSPAVPALPRFAGSSRRAVYLGALGRDIESQATQLAAAWGSTDREGARARFVEGGSESISLLVNHMAQTAEQVYDRRLNFSLALAQPLNRQLDRIKGSRSGTSLRDAIWMLEGVRELYQGGSGAGLDARLLRINAPLHARLEEQFSSTFDAIGAIAAPLEQALATNRPAVQKAAEQARALEILLKVDLASSLGVTITFSSGDGD